MKVMEIITLNHWTAGSGYSCNETFNAQELDMTEAEVNAEMDWGWWEAAERPEGEDVEIVVEYFAQDENGDYDYDRPIRTESIWESEIA